jgi:uncharacterized protein
LRTLLALALWLFAALANAQNVLPVPELTGRVIDQTGTLDAIQRKALDDRLAAFERTKGTQMVFLLVPTTQPEDIASYANRVGNAWKIGRKGVGDSVLLIVAKDDRKVRIEVAKTLEGAIPDLAARQIIDEAITPKFRAGDFIGGLSVAADMLQARVQGEALPTPQANTPGRGVLKGFDWADLAIFLFIGAPVAASVLSAFLGRKVGTLVTGAGVGTLSMLVTSSALIAGIATAVAMLWVLMTSPSLGRTQATNRGRGNPVRDGSWRGGPWVSGGSASAGGWGGFGGSSGGGGGFSDGGGFSSGGGGDFGGGGASGDW